jgi:phosphatidylserine decarboxylase
MSLREQLNFLLTNRIPRRWATLMVGRVSRIRSPWISRPSIAIWRLFGGDFGLHEAADTRFASMHELFTRRLKPGARPVDADPTTLTSPCDGVVGSHGEVAAATAYQAKGFPYSLEELMPDPMLAGLYRDGLYMTLRLKSNMYHRFHAPCDAHVDSITYISGDTWNVNPIALQRVERLYCKNERAVIALTSKRNGSVITLVPVAAILVASIRLHCIDVPLSLRYRGPNRISCDAEYAKGDELGYFEHGSTIIMFAPSRYRFCREFAEGQIVRMGDALFSER